MKTLYIVPILAIMLAVAGCTSGSRGKTVYVTEETPPVTAEAEAPAEVVEPLEVIVLAPEDDTTGTHRIDAVSFLDALVKSGCEIDKAEYKEVIRGGGITVTCKGSTDALDTDGLGDL